MFTTARMERKPGLSAATTAARASATRELPISRAPASGHAFGRMSVYAKVIGDAPCTGELAGPSATADADVTVENESDAPDASDSANVAADAAADVTDDQATLDDPLGKVSIATIPPSDEAKTYLASRPNVMGLVWLEKIQPHLKVHRWIEQGELVWKARLTGVTGRYSRQVRLLPDQKEVRGIYGNTNKDNFCDQVTELEALGDGPRKWYMLAAVKAHEDVHISHLEPTLQSIFPELKKRFGWWTTPARVELKRGSDSRRVSRAEAISKITHSEVFPIDLWMSLKAWKDKNEPLAEADHNGPTAEAEHEVVDPMIRGICQFACRPARQEQGWKPCPVCECATPQTLH